MRMRRLLPLTYLLLGLLVPTCTRHVRKMFMIDLTVEMNSTVTTPGYGNTTYPDQLYYSWDIIASTSQNIKITFEKFDVEHHPFCMWDKVLVYNSRCDDDDKYYVRRLCGRRFFYTFTSKANVMCVVFITNRRIGKGGFKATIIPIQGQGTQKSRDHPHKAKLLPVDLVVEGSGSNSSNVNQNSGTTDHNSTVRPEASRKTSAKDVSTTLPPTSTSILFSSSSTSKTNVTNTSNPSSFQLTKTTASQSTKNITAISDIPTSTQGLTSRHSKVITTVSSVIPSSGTTLPANTHAVPDSSKVTTSSQTRKVDIVSSTTARTYSSLTPPRQTFSTHNHTAINTPTTTQQQHSSSTHNYTAINTPTTTQQQHTSSTHKHTAINSPTTTQQQHTSSTHNHTAINTPTTTQNQQASSTHKHTAMNTPTTTQQQHSSSTHNHTAINTPTTTPQQHTSSTHKHTAINTPTTTKQRHTSSTHKITAINTPTATQQQHTSSTQKHTAINTPTATQQQHTSSTQKHTAINTPTATQQQHTSSTQKHTAINTPTATQQQHTSSTHKNTAINTPTTTQQQHTSSTHKNTAINTPTTTQQQHTSSTHKNTAINTPTTTQQEHTSLTHKSTVINSPTTTQQQHTSSTHTNTAINTPTRTRQQPKFTTESITMKTTSTATYKETTSSKQTDIVKTISTATKKPTTTSTLSVLSSTTHAHQPQKTSTIGVEETSEQNERGERITLCEENDPMLSINADIYVTSPKTDEGNYPPNKHCSLTVTADHPSLEIEFLDFEIEEHEQCAWDYLLLYAGATSRQLCGASKPQPMVLESNRVQIVFNSDGAVQTSGFTMKIQPMSDKNSQTRSTTSLNVTGSRRTTLTPIIPSTSKIPENTEHGNNKSSKPTTPPTTGSSPVATPDNGNDAAPPSDPHRPNTAPCSGDGRTIELDDAFGFAESPGFHRNLSYPPETICKWKIKNKANEVTVIIFESFELEYSRTCRNDKLAFYRVSQEGDLSPLSTMCGNLLPGTMNIPGDVIIRFKTNSEKEERGFRFKYINAIVEEPKDIPTCSAGYAPCWRSDTCIPVEWLCDGDFDCDGDEDEEHCVRCPEEDFSCRNGTCIERGWRCDGNPDCPGGIDEKDCVSNQPDGQVTVTIDGQDMSLCFTKDVEDSEKRLCRHLGFREAVSMTSLSTNSSYFASISSSHSGNNGTLTFMHSATCAGNISTHLLCNGQECGRKSSPVRRKRVVGGSVSADHEWPWVVGIKVNGDVFCGGTLVDTMWVVTAGHCVQQYVSKPHLLRVLAGVSDINDPNVHERLVSEVILHPNYHFVFDSDIAILRLNRPLVYGSTVKPVCLPWDKRNFTSSSHCFVAGWGVYDMQNYNDLVTSTLLRHVKTKVTDQASCKTMYKSKMAIKDTMICAGYKGGKMDACKGDSGGPLMCEVGGGRWVLTGVISWGEQCGSVQKPGVYTRVTSFIDWIDRTTANKAGLGVNCTFEESNWCGYDNAYAPGHNGSNPYIWTRKPSRLIENNHYMYAIRIRESQDEPATASLLSPEFSTDNDSCLSFSYLFSTNSNITLSVYSHTSISSILSGDDKKLWTTISEYPDTEVWQTSEIDIPPATGRLMFVSLHENGDISGVGLDNIDLTDSRCESSRELACNFNEHTLCKFSSPTGPRSVAWSVKPRGSDSQDFVASAGGALETFGYLAKSRLISPYLDYSFTRKNHCLNFSFNKNKSSVHELYARTYLSVGGSLTGRQELWNSRYSPIGAWKSVRLTTKKSSYSHIVFEVQRTTYDFDIIEFLLDDIQVTDGHCV